MDIRKIGHGTPDYEVEVGLRDAVLRRPLGLRFSEEELGGESDSFHFGCYLKDRLVGCVVLKPLNPMELKMRQLAVDPGSQKRGVGRALVEYSESFAKEHRFGKITLNARRTAVPFYEKLGYLRTGKESTEVTIPHAEMTKAL